MFVPKLIICLRDYSWLQFRKDLGAGLVVGLVALPLAMAFAIASGVPPERGLYTAVVAGFFVSTFGGSRVQIGGPTGAFVIIVAGIVAAHGYEGLAIATFMAGIILLVMGFARLGSIIKYIPYPVVTGFTSGIAVVIFSTQIKDLLGLRMASVPAEFISKYVAYAHALPSTNPWALGLAVATLLIIVFWPKRWQKIPGPLAALVGTSALATALHLPVETISSRFGGIPHGLPHWQWPHGSWSLVRTLIPSAATVALLAAIESLLSAVVADGMIGGRHKSNLELVAQGLANLASPLFGGIPATGAIARTATNIKNGGRTPVAGITHALVLLLVLMTAGPLAAKIPLATLAGILVVVSYHMSEWRSFRHLLLSPRSDIIVLLATFLLTVFVDLTVAVEVGMVLAAFLFMKHMADMSHIRDLNGDESPEQPIRSADIPAGVQIFSAHGSLFFGAAHKLIETSRAIGRTPRVLILDMTDVLHMDASGFHALEQIAGECRRQGTVFRISGMQSQPLLVLQRAGLVRRLGEETFKASLPQALDPFREVA